MASGEAREAEYASGCLLRAPTHQITTFIDAYTKYQPAYTHPESPPSSVYDFRRITEAWLASTYRR
jgi:hypothetical protein